MTISCNDCLKFQKLVYGYIFINRGNQNPSKDTNVIFAVSKLTIGITFKIAITS